MADIDVSTLDPDTPLRLKLAASLAFPDGSMTESGLKREIERGRLECERIAGKTYVSLNDIKRMRELCRESRRGSENTSANEKGGRLSGSSSMAEMKSAQDAARTIALQLIASSKATSPKSISRNGGAEIRTK
ncbi:hypothetical protein [Rhizobium leguminosarum]|uniref:hypothetical protein n=1 Tax=Rhizobium leguminosarum TaxID=384 RepID=UPI00098FEB54|nr:hypothetical protein [Rhizobium leguminosarum]MBB5259242.1 hypothetical protein [Rhizobium leguminosarum]MDX6002537.1 excisionase [Rhizobium leguminosarum]PUB61976.1 hypothetical protein DB728_24760 [Rhizobium leguminosarum bv. viciae USDA 2370]TCA72772.1 hypothetical protein E0H74_36330 [Rhizobium leguminosarum bv. viciae]TCA91096.1 hypothetical protein E0H76_27530 [Rhizobium leguminosarum bv. viciae]